MKYTLHFLADVQQDAIAGYAWYEVRSSGLGEEFLRMFYACAAELPRNPLLYPQVHGDMRRRLLRRFPYAIYFMIEEKQVVVVGLFHCARDPGAVTSQIEGRETP